MVGTSVLDNPDDVMRTVQGVNILGAIKPEYRGLLDERTQNFLAILHRAFESRRCQLMQARIQNQLAIDRGIMPDFLPETATVREDESWRCAKPGPGLADRRIEITGPVDRKMVINALNSDATQFMADFEDSTAPTWENCMDGQVNLRDAICRKIDFKASNGKEYKLKPSPAVLLVRPRGWHLIEKHFIVDGQPISASLFDFGIYFFHTAQKAVEIGQGPYFYLPKMEGHLEARLWNDAFNLAQDQIGMPRGTIRATVLIETILAAFEMDEILFELREHSAGLNCGRWDYIFSVIKKFRNHRNFVLPDRGLVTMTVPFMRAYVDLLIHTCHRRGAHAMGGMAAQIPIKGNPAANEAAMSRVRADKLREATAGHDGTWVAHPDLIKIAKEVFDQYMPGANQHHIRRDDCKVVAKDLLDTMTVNGEITEVGIRGNITVSILYMEAWLRGLGCVPIHNLMEDAATAEIARSQLWQWVHHGSTTNEGRTISKDMISHLVNDEVRKLKDEMGVEHWSKGKYDKAKEYLMKLVTASEFPEFLTTMLYDDIVSPQTAKY